MKQRGKTRTTHADDEPVIQLSRKQMVMAVCGLLVGALFFYLLGVVTSRAEDYINASEARQASGSIRPAPEAPGVPPASSANTERNRRSLPEGTQTSPRRDMLPTGDGTATTTSPSRGTRPQMPANNDKPPLNRIPPPPEDAKPPQETRTTVARVDTESLAAEKNAPAQGGPNPVRMPPPPEDKKPSEATETPPPEEAKPSEAPATQEKPPAPKEQDAEQNPIDTAAENTPKKEEIDLEKIEVPPETAAPSKPAEVVNGPFYSIQLIAFSTSNRAKAEAYAKDVRESAGLDVELEDSSDGKYVRVFVGRYADRPSALKACQELQKQERFSKVFVPQSPRSTGS